MLIYLVIDFHTKNVNYVTTDKDKAEQVFNDLDQYTMQKIEVWENGENVQTIYSIKTPIRK